MQSLVLGARDNCGKKYVSFAWHIFDFDFLESLRRVTPIAGGAVGGGYPQECARVEVAPL